MRHGTNATTLQFASSHPQILTSMALMDFDQLYWAHQFQPQSLAPIPKSINEIKVKIPAHFVLFNIIEKIQLRFRIPVLKSELKY